MIKCDGGKNVQHRATKNWPFCVSILHKFNIKTMMVTPNDLYLVFARDNFSLNASVWTMRGQNKHAHPVYDAIRLCTEVKINVYSSHHSICECSVFPRQTRSIRILVLQCHKIQMCVHSEFKSAQNVRHKFCLFVPFYFRKYPAVKFKLMSG